MLPHHFAAHAFFRFPYLVLLFLSVRLILSTIEEGQRMYQLKCVTEKNNEGEMTRPANMEMKIKLFFRTSQFTL